MSVPNIKAPPGTPRFQGEGHELQIKSPYAHVPFTSGHSRARRLFTTTVRVVRVEWFLSAAQLAAIDDWYLNVLKAGERQFAAEVMKQGVGTLWWTARWISFEIDMKTKNRGRLRGSLFLSGTPQANAPSGVALELSVTANLRDVRSTVALPTDLAMSVSAALVEDYS